MSPKIELDPVTHIYRVDGVVRPSVTQILKFSGLIQDRFYTEESRQFGIAVHKACEYVDRGTLKRGTLHPRVAPRVEAWEKFKSEQKFVPKGIEEVFYDETYKFCGTRDRRGEIKGWNAIVDIKSGVVQPWTALQLAGYAFDFYKDKSIGRYGVELKEDGTYKVTEYRNLNDYNQFLSCVSNFYWAQNHGIKGEK